MQTNPQRRWGLRLATLCVWALAAASIVYWGLLIRSPAGGAIAAMVPPVSAAAVDPARLAKLLGSVDTPAMAAPVISASSRFALIGVVADASGSGAALIAVDGKPARPYRVGAAVDTGYVLKSVGPRQALLATSADAPPSVTLEMPQSRPNLAAPGTPPARYNAPPQPTPPPGLVPNVPSVVPNIQAPQTGPGMQPQSSSGVAPSVQGAVGELRKRSRMSFARNGAGPASDLPVQTQ